MKAFTDTESGFTDVEFEIIDAVGLEPDGDVLDQSRPLGAWLKAARKYVGHILTIKVGAMLLAFRGVLGFWQAINYGNAFLRPAIARRIMVALKFDGALFPKRSGDADSSIPWGWFLDDMCLEAETMLNRVDASRPGHYANPRGYLVGLRPHEIRMIVAGVLIDTYKETGDFELVDFFRSEAFRNLGTFRMETVTDILIGLAPFQKREE